ncbi:cytochrome P450 protein [Rutstroemia sp. NJR-2017a BBW]|nr:cytochrome P450 protein [Rutstroemia sp. NJR-2017a BBW]
MKYLRYIINETTLTAVRLIPCTALRLYPLVPTNGRIALKDTILPRGGGPDGRSSVFIKEGTHYSTNSYVLHRREELWGKDAEEFKPERWETHRQGWEYQAFGGGARTCPGQAFVLSEIGYTVVRILQQYKEIESRDDRVWMENLKLTMSNTHGVVVGLVP